MIRLKWVIAISLLSTFIFAINNMYACTDFILPFESGKAPVLSARSMDFDPGFDSYLIKVPKALSFSSNAPGEDGKGKGFQWKNQYGYVGIFILHNNITFPKDNFIVQEIPVSEGLNTCGLSVASLWLNYAEFESTKTLHMNSSYIEVQDVMGCLLGTCATVEDVVQILELLHVWVSDIMKSSALIHLAVHDEKGDSLVIEYIDGERIIYKNNDIGVLTNDPPFAWQLINYNLKYNGLTNLNSDQDKLVEIVQDAQGLHFAEPNRNGSEVIGSGMYGLPGDSASPSRFARAAKIRKTFPTQFDTKQGVQYALQLLGNISVCEQETEMLVGSSYNPTLWTVVRDHSNKTIYYNTRLNHNLKSINLNELDFDKDRKGSWIPMDEEDWYIDESNKM